MLKNYTSSCDASLGIILHPNIHIRRTRSVIGEFLLDLSRKYMGRFWDLWKETHDDGTIEIMLCHKKYTLALQTDEFAELVEAINKSTYGILGKKALLMGELPKNDD